MCLRSLVSVVHYYISSINMATTARPTATNLIGQENTIRSPRDLASIIWIILHTMYFVGIFDIAGKMTGLVSRAITSPCGKIRIPLNESTDDKSQIEAYLHKYNGEGIQHIAVGSEQLYDATDLLAENGLKFMPGPPDTYYDRSVERVSGHSEPIDRMKKHGILIDGEGSVRSFSSSFNAKATKALVKVTLKRCLKA